MDIFTWISIVCFLVYGIREMNYIYGDKGIGAILICLGIILCILEIS